MGEIIYWKEFDEPKKYYDFLSQKDMEQTGKWVCDDERIKLFAFVGTKSPQIDDKNVYGIGILWFKNGERWDSELHLVGLPDNEGKFYISNDIQNKIISQAEQYLKQLK